MVINGCTGDLMTEFAVCMQRDSSAVIKDLFETYSDENGRYFFERQMKKKGKYWLLSCETGWETSAWLNDTVYGRHLIENFESPFVRDIMIAPGGDLTVDLNNINNPSPIDSIRYTFKHTFLESFSFTDVHFGINPYSVDYQDIPMGNYQVIVKTYKQGVLGSSSTFSYVNRTGENLFRFTF